MERENLEVRVGLFVLAGLLVAGFMVVSFGRFGELFERNYQVVVEFEDARGIIKNAKVLYRGAKVGKVKEEPRYDAGTGSWVQLLLEIESGVQLDKQSTFRINSYGLLGDQFVDVAPPATSSGEYLQDGDRAVGEKNVGLTEIAAAIQPLVKKVESIIGDIDSGGVAQDISSAVKRANAVLERVDNFMAEAEGGKGPLYTIMKDEQMAQELKETVGELRILSENLRKRGVLFYKDLSATAPESKGTGADKAPVRPARK